MMFDLEAKDHFTGDGIWLQDHFMGEGIWTHNPVFHGNEVKEPANIFLYPLMEHNADQAQAKRSQVSGLHIVSVSGSHFMSLLEKNKLFFKQKYFIKQTENSIKEILTSGKQNSVSDEIQKKTHSWFMKNPEGHCQCQVSEPHFLCDEV